MELPSFFADENIPFELIQWVKQRGLSISSIVEEQLFGIDDIDIIHKAYGERKIILTQDSDFGQIIFTQKVPFFVIIYLRPGHFNGSFHTATFEAILKNLAEVHENMIIIGQRKDNKIKVRIRHL